MSAMPREQDRSQQFEWVNAWAASMKTDATPVEASPPAISSAPEEAPEATVPDPAAAPLAQAPPHDQLTLDLAEIERARDTLAALPVGPFSARRRTQALILVPSRTSDAVPVIVGGVLALVMLTVFGAAA